MPTGLADCSHAAATIQLALDVPVINKLLHLLSVACTATDDYSSDGD